MYTYILEASNIHLYKHKFTTESKMCPPGTDQTERGGMQRWNLLAPSIKQSQKLFTASGRSNSGMMEFMSSSSKSAPLIDAFNRLARPNAAAISTAHSSAKKTSPAHPGTAPQRTSLSPLEALPAEILAIVLNHDTFSQSDILSLGSCSQTLWAHVWRHVREDCRKNAAPWAGTPLIAVGDWLRDLPQAIYDVFPDLHEADRRWKTGGPVGGIGFGRGKCPARRWNSNLTWGSHTHEDLKRKHPREEWTSAGKLLPKILMPSLEKAVLSPRVGEKWVLRNLSSTEFVRFEIKEGGETGARAIIDGTIETMSLSLDQALLLKILWTQPSNFRGLEHEFTRGEWAGHSFDVVLDSGDVIKGWKDVTLAVESLATAVASRNPGWRTRAGPELRMSRKRGDRREDRGNE